MREDIERLIKDNKIFLFGSKSSIKRLEQIMSEEEKVLFLIPGNATMEPENEMKVDVLSIANKEPIILAITDRRTILIRKVLTNEKIEQFPNKEIREHRILRDGLVGGKLRIVTLTRTFDIDLNCKKELVNRIDGILQKVESSSHVKHSQNSDKGRDKKAGSAIKQIEELAKLRDKGIITELEFKSKKEELLKRI